MAEPTSCSLNELRALLKRRAGQVSYLASLPPLSFRAGAETSPDGLRSPALLDPTGQIASSIHGSLDIIAEADSFNQVALPGSVGDVITSIVFNTSDQRSTGLQIDEASKTTFCSVKELTDSLLLFSSKGIPLVNPAGFIHHLPSNDAFILAALIDLQCMEYQKSNSVATAMVVPYSLEAIAGSLEALDGIFSKPPTQTGLSPLVAFAPDKRISILLSALIPHEPVTGNDIQASLARLVAASLVTPAQVGWCLSQEISVIAQGLIQADKAAFFEECRLTNGLLETEDLLMLAVGEGYLCFGTSSEMEDQVSLTGYAKPAGEAYLRDFFHHPLETQKKVQPKLPVPAELPANQPNKPAPAPLPVPKPLATEVIPILTPQPVPQPESLRTSTLVIDSGSLAGKTISVSGRLSIGRGADNILPIPDDQLSRRHAIIESNGENCWIVDQGSTNGVFVNGARIPPGPTYLKPGDAIMLGKTQMHLSSPTPAVSFPSTLQAGIQPVNMICPKCGAGNPPGNMFCRVCGASLTAVTPPSPPLPAPLLVQAPYRASLPPPTPKRNTLRIILSIGGMLISCGCLMISLLTYLNGFGGLNGLKSYLPSFITHPQIPSTGNIAATATSAPTSATINTQAAPLQIGNTRTPAKVTTSNNASLLSLDNLPDIVLSTADLPDGGWNITKSSFSGESNQTYANSYNNPAETLKFLNDQGRITDLDYVYAPPGDPCNPTNTPVHVTISIDILNERNGAQKFFDWDKYAGQSVPDIGEQSVYRLKKIDQNYASCSSHYSEYFLIFQRLNTVVNMIMPVLENAMLDEVARQMILDFGKKIDDKIIVNSR